MPCTTAEEPGCSFTEFYSLPFQGYFLHEPVRAGGAVAAVDGDGFPFHGGNPRIAPVGDIGAAALESGGENGVDLRQGKGLDGIVLVDKEGHGVQGHFDSVGL